MLKNQSPGAGGEIQLTDAMIALMTSQTIRPFEFRGRTFDCGSPAGFVSANLHMALSRADLAAFVNMEIEALTTARSAVA